MDGAVSPGQLPMRRRDIRTLADSDARFADRACAAAIPSAVTGPLMPPKCARRYRLELCAVRQRGPHSTTPDPSVTLMTELQLPPGGGTIRQSSSNQRIVTVMAALDPVTW
jgi:hypothetical protein